MAKVAKTKIQSMITALNDINIFVRDCTTEHSTKTQLMVQLEEISTMADKFEDCQAIVEEDDQTKSQEEWIEERSFFRKLLRGVKVSLLELIEKYEATSNSVTTPSYSEISRSKKNMLRLPVLKPPSFNGDWQQWTAFIDEFNTMFHNNEDVPIILKFHYLKTCVEGPAKEVIQNFKTTEENYQVAYDVLKLRYENKSAIIQSHMRSLLNTPKVMTASASELQRLHYHISSNINALTALQQPVDQWDAWLVTLMCTRLDSVTVAEWQLKQDTKELPKYKDLELFLSNRITAYEAGDIAMISCSDDANKTNVTNKPRSKKVFLTNTNNNQHNMGKTFASPRCNHCAGPHRIPNCEKFEAMSIKERQDLVEKNRLCFNCLYYGHRVDKCRFPPCSKCGKRHHEKLHTDGVSVDQQSSEPEKVVNLAKVLTSQNNFSIGSNSTNNRIILATAVVCITDIKGTPQLCRAVIDSGAEISLITAACAERLQLPLESSACPISGIGMTHSRANSIINAKLSSRINSCYCTKLQFHILSSITNKMPSQYFDVSSLEIPDSIKTQLADPHFNIPGQIDVLLGAEVSYSIFSGQRYPLSDCAILHRTTLGWVLAGKTFLSSDHVNNESPSHQPNINSALALLSTKSETLRQEEAEVERHFLRTVCRDENGRFVVRLPLRQPIDELGDSRCMAVQRLFNVEKRLAKDPYLATEYRKFMAEYLALGHMEVVPENETEVKSYYLPHHAIIKSNSLTTKVRVVFDGSAPSKSGVSLNDILSRGPATQPELFSILLRFRVHKYVLTGDVEKMYRQVSVSSSDCNLQRIVYRDSPEDPVVDYRLLTVTYGTKSASFLATKCLSQLANDTSVPSVSRAIAEDFYVDDLITGATSINECFFMYTELCRVLNAAGMPLRKWCSNSPLLLNKIPHTQDDPSYLLRLNDEDTISTLGLTWQPSIDCFRFVFKNWDPPVEMSKRLLLSDISKIFDPLGLLTPVLIKGKIFLQQLWTLKLGWDSPLSTDIVSRWKQFYHQFKELEHIRVPRVVLDIDSPIIELHGFADASQEAYGACVYIRSVAASGSITVSLAVSKSRVAPLKPTTIPRLELSGALLLAELAHNVLLELAKVNIIINSSSIMLWSDSTIVLSWINTSKPLKVFVANRVAQITDLTSPSQWMHVPTSSNPADMITRGIDVQSLTHNQLWWNGPSWLSQDRKCWPACPPLTDDVPETRQVKLVLAAVLPATTLLDQYSDFMRLIRITAWVLRFCSNSSIPSNRCDIRKLGPLTVVELSKAKTTWLLHTQRCAFQNELDKLSKNQQLSKQSQLKKLHPFIDTSGLIRVGGRLSQSNLSDSMKFPIVLPSKSRLTRLLFEYEHKRLLHIGPQGLLSHIQGTFWPIRGRIIAKSVVHNCLTCYKTNPTLQTPLMAPLPRARVTMERPFARTGVDFCGPVHIRSGIRRVQSIKGYIAVFVCFVTRAMHLELVSDLTTNAFMAALFRFMARRGQCSHIYSDNGTNFVGAEKELSSYFKVLPGKRSIQEMVSDHGIQWHFIPPAAPHFGGLWEAAVKSAKTHLIRMSGSALLNFEEMATLLCRIEAVLNNRPLTPTSNCPSDYTALTPAHFLVGGNLLLPPEPDCPEVPRNKLQRWKLVCGMAQGFWRRWSAEYLPQLQVRGKWTKPSRKIKIGDLAILKTDNLATMKWNMVRVVDIHPGVDGVVRVVSVQASNGSVTKRPVVKIALLPGSEEEEED